MNLTNKVVVVTGASSGIGRAAALLFAGRGARVAVNSRRNVAGGRDVVQRIEQSGGAAVYIQADVSDEAEVERLFAETSRALGPVEVLVNNAGSSFPTPFLESTKEDWMRAFDANFFSTVICSKAAAKIMLDGEGGKIINTASIRGHSSTGREAIMGYSAAKAAVINFTRTLAKQLAPQITVNAVSPGFVATPPIESMSDAQKAGFIEATPIGRLIKPEEMAEAFLFLAESDAVTGTVMLVDGGFSLKMA